MPISNNTSYVPTMNEFIAHWGLVNAALGTPLILSTPDQSGMMLANFSALKIQLQDKLQTVVDFLNDQEIAAGSIRLLKAGMLARFNEFTTLLEGYWGGTAFIDARPYAPSVSDGVETFLEPMRDAFSLWGKLNAALPPTGVSLPLVLSDGTVVAAFGAAIGTLQEAYVTEANARQNAALARGERNILMDTARLAMVNYRKLVPARCAQFPALVATLPALTPPPGHTPEPVNASAVFQAPDKAKVVYDASPEPTLARYELRGNPGGSYEEDDAVTLADHGPADAREFVTGFGLTQPGTQASFKVFVVLETGNEAGSGGMTVQRPG